MASIQPRGLKGNRGGKKSAVMKVRSFCGSRTLIHNIHILGWDLRGGVFLKKRFLGKRLSITTDH